MLWRLVVRSKLWQQQFRDLSEAPGANETFKCGIRFLACRLSNIGGTGARPPKLDHGFSVNRPKSSPFLWTLGDGAWCGLQEEQNKGANPGAEPPNISCLATYIGKPACLSKAMEDSGGFSGIIAASVFVD